MLTLDNLLLKREKFELRADFTCERGDRVAIIGPSGAGKSTLLDLIAGFATPDAGQIMWDGTDISHTPADKRDISMVFQSNNLFPHLSVFENVALGIAPNLRLTSAQKSNVMDALARTGIFAFKDKFPGELSGGQASRVAIARVLVRDRAMIALDEPFAALGPALKQDMLGLVCEICKERDALLLMVTHDPNDALNSCDTCIFVDAGCASAPQSTRELFADPPPALREYFG